MNISIDTFKIAALQALFSSTGWILWQLADEKSLITWTLPGCNEVNLSLKYSPSFAMRH